RRHTRWPRDWSSDVCSSDLLHLIGLKVVLKELHERLEGGHINQVGEVLNEVLQLDLHAAGEGIDALGSTHGLSRHLGAKVGTDRSEEQRLNSSHVAISYAVF